MLAPFLQGTPTMSILCVHVVHPNIEQCAHAFYAIYLTFLPKELKYGLGNHFCMVIQFWL